MVNSNIYNIFIVIASVIKFGGGGGGGTSSSCSSSSTVSFVLGLFVFSFPLSPYFVPSFVSTFFI
jgi:hypothetical protein